MSVTREEIIAAYEGAVVSNGLADAAGNEAAAKSHELFKAGLSALRPVSREQVEKMWRGEWIIQERKHSDFIKKCSKCGFPISGWWGADKFCAYCGSPMTDEAVEIVMERLEALKDAES